MKINENDIFKAEMIMQQYIKSDVITDIKDIYFVACTYKDAFNDLLNLNKIISDNLDKSASENLKCSEKYYELSKKYSDLVDKFNKLSEEKKDIINNLQINGLLQ